MSPKSLLRHQLAVSNPEELARGRFEPAIDESERLDRDNVQRILCCSGKVYYDLLIGRRERDRDDVAIVRLEQFYPFPSPELRTIFERYPAAGEIWWVQEEPENMGGWGFVAPRLSPIIGNRALAYVGREAAASPAVGNYKVHETEQAELVDRALKPVALRAVRKAHAS
jgi:2-oxoglutarate dehydrogenase E1 component